MGDAGRVDQDIDFAELLEDRVVQCLEGGALKHVAGDAHRTAAHRLDLGGHLLYLVEAARAGDDIGSGAGETERDGVAESSGSADDYRDFSRQVKEMFVHE